MTKIKYKLLSELFERIKLKGISNNELSVMLGVKIQNINNWENQTNLPSIKMLPPLIELAIKDVTQLDTFKESSIGEKMYILRASIGLTLVDLSDAIMYGRELLSKWERAIREPSAYDVVRFSSFYGVSVELFGIQDISYLTGHTIREERLANNMTQVKLAEKTQVSAGTISNYERNIVQPDKKTLNLIEDALGLPKDYIVEGDKIGVV